MMDTHAEKLDFKDLNEIAGGVCVTKSGTRYYKADDTYIYFEDKGQDHKVRIRDLQCMAGKTCAEMRSFINKINDTKVYGKAENAQSGEVEQG